MLPHRHFHRLAWIAVLLALTVIVFGAFVRLSNAGLSCPDWPTCYGKAAWPTHADQVVDHVATAIRPVEPSKAWREQFHRMIAGLLGVLVLSLALLATRRRPQGWLHVVGAAFAVAVAIPLYMRGMHVPASVLAAVGEALVFASKAGADPAKVRQALMGGFAASRILEVHGERMIKRTFAPGFRIQLHQKDLNLALQGAKALGVSLPGTANAAQLMQACAAHGLAESDHSALVRALEILAKHELNASSAG